MGPAFCLLGPLEVRSPSGELVALGGQKQRVLLAMLLVHRGQPVSDDRLVLALWGDAASDGAATTLRSHVVRVRRLLEEAGTPATLGRRSGGYVLDVALEEVDADCFELLLAEGRAAAADGRLARAAELLEHALGLWRGEVLADLEAPEFVLAPAADLAEKRLLAQEALIDVQLASGRHLDAVPALQSLVEQHPFRERLVSQLALALYRSGRQADALAALASTRARLADELGLDPSAELQDLEAAVLRQSPDLDPAPVVADASATAAGPRVDLVEREAERARLLAAFAGAAAGEGAVVAVTGEAGVGKTSLVEAACAEARSVRVLRGHCDPLSTPRPYGPLRDIAVPAGLTVWEREAEVVLADVCDEVVSALVAEPTVLVVEDLHWVDAATVEVLRFLVRRTAALQLSLVLTYRDHEIGPQHPARPLLADLARFAHAGFVRLAGLSVQGVAELLGEGPLDPAQVHALTGGNPFFVVEVGSEPDRPLPTTVRDALLDHTASLDPADLQLLQLAAVSPERLDDAVLRVLGVDLPTLERLEATGLLGGGLSFRHELARQAVVSTIPAAGTARLHALVLDALEAGGVREPAVLTHHAVAARDADRAFAHAYEAAELAVRSGAHTEAAAFYEIAVRHQRDDDPAARAELLQKLAFEQYMISRLDEAISNVSASFELWQHAGDAAGLARAYDTSAVFTYYDADRHGAEALAERAVEVADEAGLLVPHAAARATRGFLGYLRGDLDLARTCAFDAAGAAATASDETLLALRAEMVTVCSDLLGGDPGVRPRLLALIARARAAGFDEVASTGYSQLASLDVEHARLDLAESVLAESIPFTVRRDIPICRHWQTSLRARVQLGTGRWDGALLDAGSVIDEDGMAIAKLWPLLISALVPVRRGEPVDPGPLLDQAWSLAVGLDEPLRRLSGLAVLAEVMWTRDVVDARVVDHGQADLERLAHHPGVTWAAGDLAVWLHRSGLLQRVPEGLPEPHAAEIEGRHEDAAAWWAQRGQSFNAALSRRAVDELRALGALGTADRVAALSTRGIR